MSAPVRELQQEVAGSNVGMDFDSVEIVTERPKELEIQCVVFVGDYLTTEQKRIPAYRLGGKLYPIPDFYTVPNAVVARCAITRLKNKAMRGVHKQLVDEKQWKAGGAWVDSFTLKNQWNPTTGQYEDLLVGAAPAHDCTKSTGIPCAVCRRHPSIDIVYRAIRPIQEIGRIAQDGVVALGEECGIKSGTDIKEAQYHYFPNWNAILLGEETFPERLRDMEEHLRNRREQTRSPQMRAIGDAYLLSCDRYRELAKANRIDNQTAAIKEADGKGIPNARYDEVSERLFRELELTREDKLHESTARSQNDAAKSQADIAQAITLLSRLVAQQGAAASVAPPAAFAPAPVNAEQAAAEVERSTADAVVDIQTIEETPEPEVATAPEVVPEPNDDEVAKYLADAGVGVEEGE